MSRNRDVLEVLKQDQLVAASDRFGMPVRDRHVCDDQVMGGPRALDARDTFLAFGGDSQLTASTTEM